ncbi:hypothetical protein SAMN05216259_11315 [Actinacidiphila guanduensis]|uniref:Uncharacterized protein n=2 Tax=Actinacidiphila guanduensis TaxID=310781 RepID=A0A1H0MLV9_9ACTN|nr:hypothetical protein SAMN05216259_11315 [Actinacidiphila guanduensis]
MNQARQAVTTAGSATDRTTHLSQRKTPPMCNHQPQCPTADSPDREAAVIVAGHPEQGWSLLCNGVLVFEDTGEILPDGEIIAPHRPLGTGRVTTAA